MDSAAVRGRLDGLGFRVHRIVQGGQAGDGPEQLSFGTMEPLVRLLQEMPPDKVLPILVQKLGTGTELTVVVPPSCSVSHASVG